LRRVNLRSNHNKTVPIFDVITSYTVRLWFYSWIVMLHQLVIKFKECFIDCLVIYVNIIFTEIILNKVWFCVFVSQIKFFNFYRFIRFKTLFSNKIITYWYSVLFCSWIYKLVVFSWCTNLVGITTYTFFVDFRYKIISFDYLFNVKWISQSTVKIVT